MSSEYEYTGANGTAYAEGDEVESTQAAFELFTTFGLRDNVFDGFGFPGHK